MSAFAGLTGKEFLRACMMAPAAAEADADQQHQGARVARDETNLPPHQSKFDRLIAASQVPIVVTSRADSVRARMVSRAVAA